MFDFKENSVVSAVDHNVGWRTYLLMSSINFGWEYLRTVEEVASMIAREQFEVNWLYKARGVHRFEDFSSAWEQALTKAKAYG
jgi:hypothetical protein